MVWSGMSTRILMDSVSRLIARLWRHLSRRRKRQLWLSVSLMMVSALLDVISLGAVLPFITVLANPDRVFDYEIVSKVAGVFGIETSAGLILPLTVGFALSAGLAGASRVVSLWVVVRVTAAIASDLSIEAYRRTLHQPYETHVQRNSGEVMSNVLAKVDAVSHSVVRPLQALCGSALTIVFIAVALIVIEPATSLIAIIGLGCIYTLIGRMAKRKLDHNSLIISETRASTFRNVQEGLGGIRDVLLDGSQSHFVHLFRESDRNMRRANATNQIISATPRLVIEVFALILISGLAYWFNQRTGGFAGSLPVLGALAFGGQRLLPALQQGFFAWSMMMGSRAMVVEAIEFLEQPMDDADSIGYKPLGLSHEIRLSGVSFRYQGTSVDVLQDVNLVFRQGQRIGIVGATGSGKSTLLDLIMGLLEPSAGTLEVDGVTVRGAERQRWMRTIAHVPQHVFLTDESFKDNIVFGSIDSHIEEERVYAAAARACISDFIEDRPNGYREVVGERGARLSGGQRQRIGIARALYRQPDVLILDEATSALDMATEREVMAGIAELSHDVTIFQVAHRLSTVEGCDMIVEMEAGRVVATGTFSSLLQSSPSFRQMVAIVGKDGEDD
jgi:ABC-type multidrug transport system fused ATPase/permease subunit